MFSFPIKNQPNWWFWTETWGWFGTKSCSARTASKRWVFQNWPCFLTHVRGKIWKKSKPWAAPLAIFGSWAVSPSWEKIGPDGGGRGPGGATRLASRRGQGDFERSSRCLDLVILDFPIGSWQIHEKLGIGRSICVLLMVPIVIHCPRMHIFIHQQLEMKWRCTMSAPCRMVKNSIPRARGVKPSPLHSVKVKWSLGGTWGWHPCAKVRWQNSPWRQSLPMAMQVGFGNARHVKPASSIFSELENLLRGFLDMLTHWVWCNPFIKWLKCQTSSFLANPILGLGVSTEHYWYHVLQVHLPKFPRKPRWSSRLSCWISSQRTTSFGMAGWWRLCRRRAVVGRCPRTRVNKGLGPPGSQQIFTFFTSQRRGCWIGFKHQLNFQIFFSCCWIGLQPPQKGWVFNPSKRVMIIRYYKIL